MVLSVETVLIHKLNQELNFKIKVIYHQLAKALWVNIQVEVHQSTLLKPVHLT